MSDDVIENPENLNTEPPTDTPPADTPPAIETLDFVQDKYRADGRSEQEAAYEQAKAYPELQKMFGSFTGAPDEYEITINEEAAELVNADLDAEFFTDLKALGKDLQLSNDGMNKLVDVFVQNTVAEANAETDRLKGELESLHNGQERIQAIDGFASKNLSPEQYEAFKSMPQSAAQIEALEEIIGLAKGAPAQPADVQVAQVTEAEVQAMQFELDDYGNRRIATDKEFAKAYRQKLNQLHGTQPHRQQMG